MVLLSISIISLYIAPVKKIYLIDVHRLEMQLSLLLVLLYCTSSRNRPGLVGQPQPVLVPKLPMLVLKYKEWRLDLIVLVR